MHALTEFLFPAPARRTAGAIVSWWEKRRLAYNVAVGAAGVFSLGVVTVVGTIIESRVWPPPLIPVVIFGVLANVCYLIGPAAEILIEKLWGRTVLPAGPTLYRMGLTFSVGLALFPALLMMIWAVARVVAGVFF